jgi:SAM-dependent methyltransferase/acyl carrier protein
MAEAEMSDWVQRTVDRIGALQPRRVLEIGCGTGLLLFRVAPGVETYHGTEISAIALDRLQRELSAAPDRYRNVVLSRQMAHDFSGLAPDAYDAVILNSVVQYFPSVDYLVRVLEGAVALVKPGGSIFLGDLRNLCLLRAFHASLELHAARPSMPTGELRRRIEMGVRHEKELAIDPALFTALRSHLPRVSRVEIQLKRGRYRNELSKFRYDVILHVDGEPVATADGPWQWWQKDFSNLGALSQMLRERQVDILGVAGMVNARVAEEVEAMERIASDGAPATAGEMRRTLEEVSIAGTVDPEELFVLAEEMGYAAEVRWGTRSSRSIDLVLQRRDMAWVGLSASDQAPTRLDSNPPSWGDYANNPVHAEFTRRLVAELRQRLAAQLPEYMMPSAFVVLDGLPLTAHGKIDRLALPAPDESWRERETEYVEPRTETEVTLASIWGEVLNLQEIGVHDDFFQLGGHSLLATQTISRVRERLRIELPLRALFEYPTVAGLAAAIDAAHGQAEPLAPSVITRSEDAAAADLLANLDQLTEAEIEMLLREASPDDLGS